MVLYDTDYPADSVEFCPHPGHEDIFVCGTYKLLRDGDEDVQTSVETPATQRRIGKCIVMRVIRQDEECDKLSLIQELETSAILDMKWSGAGTILAIAESEGRIRLCRLTSDSILEEIQKIQCRNTDTLCLSLDWSNRRDRGPGSIISSWSDGTLSLLAPQADGSLDEARSWHAHDYEPWIAAWDYWNTNVAYSGGDDMKLKGWDIRQDGSSPIFANGRFEAGVTSIQSHPHIENILAVGSYDSTVRIFDTRKPLLPLMVVDVGGGAWRVKWHPSASRQKDMLVACMHDGFKIVRFSRSLCGTHDTPEPSESTEDWDIVTRFDKHTSLAYGVDWSHSANAENCPSLIASCSFYDHSLHTWKG